VSREEVVTEAQEGKASRLWRRKGFKSVEEERLQECGGGKSSSSRLWRRKGFKTLKSTCQPRAEAAPRLTPRRVCRREREGDEKAWWA
jgi:hypothetical protein